MVQRNKKDTKTKENLKKEKKTITIKNISKSIAKNKKIIRNNNHDDNDIDDDNDNNNNNKLIKSHDMDTSVIIQLCFNPMAN
jgi:hypothetical protein